MRSARSNMTSTWLLGNARIAMESGATSLPWRPSGGCGGAARTGGGKGRAGGGKGPAEREAKKAKAAREAKKAAASAVRPCTCRNAGSS